MASKATVNANNLYYKSRTGAGVTNREIAAYMLGVDPRTVSRWEGGEYIPPPETVLKMEQEYGDHELVERHCAEMCPIGIARGYAVEEFDLKGAVVSLIVAANKVVKMRDRFLEMIEDGRVDETEERIFSQFMACVDELECKLRGVRVCAKKELHKQKNRTA